MKSFFGTDRLKRSRILKAILFIIIMISAVSSMSLLYKSIYAQEENQHKYAAKKRVLFISSYSYAWETVPEQIAGIKEVLNEDVVIDYKFMDSKNLTSSESVDDFYRHMVYYLGEVEPYDAIIVGDDAAFNFAVDNKDTLFKDIPIFFEGVNNGDKAVEVSASSQITGVVESLSYKNTIKAASKIIPDAKKIVAILDDTVTGRGERIQYYKYKNIYPQYEFDEINASKLSQHDLIEKIKSLDSDTILIYIMCSSDKDGNTYIDSQGIKLVSENAPVPTFSIVSIGMGKGVIGGEMVSQKEMAKIAASMVQQYFNGTDVSSIEVQTEPPRVIMFDENVMKKYEVSSKLLPKTAIIINHEQNFFERNRDIIIFSGIIIAILIVISVCLFASNMHKEKINKNLSISTEKYEKLANHDMLTGLPNRMAFKEDLIKYFGDNKQFSVFLFDIDKFKHINDTYGHNSGDMVLREVAQRIQKINDNLFRVYRFAGDEFTVIVDSHDYNVVGQYAQRIIDSFKESYEVDNAMINIHSSLGIAMVPENGTNEDSVVAAADDAMYFIKKLGGNNYHFSDK